MGQRHQHAQRADAGPPPVRGRPPSFPYSAGVFAQARGRAIGDEFGRSGFRFWRIVRPMHYVLGRHKVADVKAWKKSIEADRKGHLAIGLHFEEVWVNVDNPEEIFFTFEVDDLEKARAGLRKAGAFDEEKRQRGEIPELFFLESK
jgi:hypothetical protein